MPVMYSQDRVGKGGKRFTIVKFRTMVQDADADGSYKPAVEGDVRVTRVRQVPTAHAPRRVAAVLERAAG